MKPTTADLYFAHYRCDPFVNMAFDEWMLRKVMETPGLLIARLYSWHPGAITFGVNQRQESAVNLSLAGATPVIRRITGGRAIFHDESEVTYSLALNVSRQDAHNLYDEAASEVNDRITGGLIAFLAQIGVHARKVRRSSVKNSRPEFFHKAPCFSSLAKYELVAGDGKVVASAQRRHADSLLQHGSIKVNGIATHPALPIGSRSPDEQLKPIDRQRFVLMSELFRQSMASAFCRTLRKKRLDPGQEPEVVAHTAFVRTNSLAKRDFFAQNPELTSH